VEPLYKQNLENSYAVRVCCVRATEVWEGECRHAIFRAVDILSPPCKLTQPSVCGSSTLATSTRTPQSPCRISSVTIPSRSPRVSTLRNSCSRSPEPPPAPIRRLIGASSSLTARNIKRSRASFTSSRETTSRLTEWMATSGRTSSSLPRLLHRCMRCRSETRNSTGVRRWTSH
jgi:hypothetical protein